ncbi:YlmH family RNA-binding protein [Blautia sp. MSJ-19]|uniref:YlmH family RNA-binding protein n=1 Tax=Blautia sp. MSJ-19 TaxID=2841517 RepID=UPI001C0EF2E7|nr:YlmH/Sll1252 family protein [Blautia sp. MSJ-19]MBU5481484.1 RNA-binding protein [Blautia sp. MSJ-19]
MEKDEFFIKRIRELANLSYQRDIVTFSDFLNLNEQNIIKDRKNQMPGVIMEYFGGYEQAERQMVAFHPDALFFPWEYPIRCLKIEPLAAKFSENLTHRDFLGAVLNLGLDRSVIGDILIQNHTAWMFCHEKIAPFIIENLTRVRHTTVKVSVVDNPELYPQPEFQIITGTCASVRLDALIGLAFQASRSSMVSYIEGSQVFVNGKLITSNGYEPKEGDIISVRGKGRFRYEGVSRQTKKGRSSVKLLRYQ